MINDYVLNKETGEVFISMKNTGFRKEEPWDDLDDEKKETFWRIMEEIGDLVPSNGYRAELPLYDDKQIPLPENFKYLDYKCDEDKKLIKEYAREYNKVGVYDHVLPGLEKIIIEPINSTPMRYSDFKKQFIKDQKALEKLMIDRPKPFPIGSNARKVIDLSDYAIDDTINLMAAPLKILDWNIPEEREIMEKHLTLAEIRSYSRLASRWKLLDDLSATRRN